MLTRICFSAVSKEDYEEVSKMVEQKRTENERLLNLVEENQLEISNLKEIVEAQQTSQQLSIHERLQQEEELTNEVNTLQKGTCLKLF